MNSTLPIFSRTRLLLGDEVLKKLNSAKVIIFGVGGVGSWCAESLIRTGVTNLTIVDSDIVNVTNVNRQLMATQKTIGEKKVEALKERLLEINDKANILAIDIPYTLETEQLFKLDDYDFVVDAIDSLTNKALLILNSCKANVKLFSSMGAALKIDPTKIQVAEFWSVKGCPLAAALRRKFKKNKTFPKKKFKCVFSEELMQNNGVETQDNKLSKWDEIKASINGSLSHITAIYGFTLAGLIVKSIYEQEM